MQLEHIILGALLVAVLQFWWKTMRAREKAQKLAQIACQKERMQLLDGTVALKKFAFEKNRNKNRYLLRYFSFEFSSNGTDRREGVMALYKESQYFLYMDLPESPTIIIENNENDSDNKEDEM